MCVGQTPNFGRAVALRHPSSIRQGRDRIEAVASPELKGSFDVLQSSAQIVTRVETLHGWVDNSTVAVNADKECRGAIL